MTSARPTAVIVLAAGEGTRMRSAVPKVLHQVAGRSLLGHVIEAASSLEPAHLLVVVGHGREQVIAHLAETAPWAVVVVQEQQGGTGHATRIALERLSEMDVPAGSVVVLAGDTPLLAGPTLADLLAQHTAERSAATVLTARVPEPAGYGRIVRDESGGLTSIVEDADASPEQRAIDEVNAGIYAFETGPLAQALSGLGSQNAQGEEYLTDAIGGLRVAGAPVSARLVADHREILGVNDRVQLAQAAATMRDRINEGWMRQGVSMLDPSSVWLDVDVELAPDVVLRADVTLRGPTSVASAAVIGPATTLVACEVGEAAEVVHTWGELAVIGPGAHVGPYTHLRPGTVLGGDTKAGSFVEIKNSTIGDDAKVPHLSYVGDAEIGEGSNIGASTVFVNYDGVAKHRTKVGSHVRIGSDTMLVAPVTIGDGAYTAAGSVVTEDVPPGALALGRSRQRNIEGWVAAKRPGTASAEAAGNGDDSEESTGGSVE